VVPGKLSLVIRQWRCARRHLVIPAVPAMMAGAPIRAPMITPAWRRVRLPSAEINRRLTIIRNGNTQDIQRDIVRGLILPWPVIPAALVPIITLEHPVATIIEKIISTQIWGVIHRQTLYRHHLRIIRHINAYIDAGQSDIDADIRVSGQDWTTQQGTCN